MSTVHEVHRNRLRRRHLPVLRIPTASALARAVALAAGAVVAVARAVALAACAVVALARAIALAAGAVVALARAVALAAGAVVALARAVALAAGAVVALAGAIALAAGAVLRGHSECLQREQLRQLQARQAGEVRQDLRRLRSAAIGTRLAAVALAAVALARCRMRTQG